MLTLEHRCWLWVFFWDFVFEKQKAMCSKPLPSPSVGSAAALAAAEKLFLVFRLFYPGCSCLSHRHTLSTYFVYSHLTGCCVRAWYRCYLMLFNSYWGQAIHGHHYAKIKVTYGSSKTLPELVYLLHGNLSKKPRAGLLVGLHSSHSSIPIHQWRGKGVL